MESGRKHNSLL